MSRIKNQTYQDLLTLERTIDNVKAFLRDNDIVRASNVAKTLPVLGERIDRELRRRSDHALARSGHTVSQPRSDQIANTDVSASGEAQS